MQRAAEPVTVAAATPGPQWATPSRQPVDGEKAVAPTPGGTNVEVDIKQFREMMQEDPKNCIAVSRAEVRMADRMYRLRCSTGGNIGPRGHLISRLRLHPDFPIRSSVSRCLTLNPASRS